MGNNRTKKSLKRDVGSKKVKVQANQVASASNELTTASKKSFSRGARRRHLDDRLRLLQQRSMTIENELRKLEDNRFYRTCIFGSARIKTDSKAYNDVVELARLLATSDIDILTGGGPGLMEAANLGAKRGRTEARSKSLSLGLTIELEWEPEPNHHLDVKRHHLRFSSRLDDFMRLSHSIIVTPGGIGTLLELFFAWQLIQVKHMTTRPIVLMGREFWSGVIAWLKKKPLAEKLMGSQDFDFVTVVDTPKEAFKIIADHHTAFRKLYKAHD